MKRLLCWILATVVAILLGAPAPSAAGPFEIRSGPGYTYDSHAHVAVPTHTTTQRGPPTAYDQGDIYKAVGHWSRGASAYSVGVTLRAPIVYAHRAGFAQLARATGTDQQQAQRDDTALTSLTSSGVAPNTGPRALPIGPWGQRVADARGKLPSSWGPGEPNSKKVGTKWFDPAAPKANGVRIDQGDPGSSFPSQQVDHVIVRSGGNVLGPDGLPITGSVKQNPQAQIPLDGWLTWSSWNAP